MTSDPMTRRRPRQLPRPSTVTRSVPREQRRLPSRPAVYRRGRRDHGPDDLRDTPRPLDGDRQPTGARARDVHPVLGRGPVPARGGARGTPPHGDHGHARGHRHDRRLGLQPRRDAVPRAHDQRGTHARDLLRLLDPHHRAHPGGSMAGGTSALEHRGRGPGADGPPGADRPPHRCRPGQRRQHRHRRPGRAGPAGRAAAGPGRRDGPGRRRRSSRAPRAWTSRCSRASRCPWCASSATRSSAPPSMAVAAS